MSEPITIFLSAEDIELARTVAAARASAGDVRWEDSPSGDQTPEQVEFMGMLGEIAAARHYGVEPYTKIERRRADGGADLRLGEHTADVKATTVPPDPHKPKQPHLLVQAKDVPYDAYISAYVALPMDQGIVQLLGYATREMVLRYPYEPFAFKRPVRAVPNNVLCPIRRNTRPDELRYDELDYQRCRKLNGAMDVPNGVRLRQNGQRGTLINALVSIPGFPPGVRVVLEGEKEIVRDSDTKSNPGGTPISRDFYSADVEVVER